MSGERKLVESRRVKTRIEIVISQPLQYGERIDTKAEGVLNCAIDKLRPHIGPNCDLHGYVVAMTVENPEGAE